MAPGLGITAVALIAGSGTPWFSNSAFTIIAINMACLFLCGMVCHGELVARKPAPTYLTGFYLSIALGGAIGGCFVALLSPVIFNSYLEFDIGLILCVAIAIFAAHRCESQSRILRSTFQVVLPFVLIFGSAAAIVTQMMNHAPPKAQSRNFFGRLTIHSKQMVAERRGTILPFTVTELSHGDTVHGRQVRGNGAHPDHGMTYYWPGSGGAFALQNHPHAARRGLRVGVIGLGAGTLAHYARKGDHYTFYEINQDIEKVARTHFSYLADAQDRGATIDVKVGDARILLEQELRTQGGQDYDVLVLDAFSSDAIPTHLLTRECNYVYWQHLAKGGILAAHISNRHLDLAPVIRGLANDMGKESRLILAESTNATGSVTAHWGLVTSNHEFLRREELRVSGAATHRQSLLWTDSHSSLWHVLK